MKLDPTEIDGKIIYIVPYNFMRDYSGEHDIFILNTPEEAAKFAEGDWVFECQVKARKVKRKEVPVTKTEIVKELE